jgi:uncharacterized protein (TIGR02453 family)
MAATDITAARFTGFSEDALQFMLELQAEQSRVWFKAHQGDFERLWRRPLELFVTELTSRLVDVYPGFADAEPRYFRIQRDTRFARDKSPYKTNVAASVPLHARIPGDTDDLHTVPAMYVSFGLDGDFLGIGAWHMAPETLTRFRALLDSSTGARIARLIAALEADGFEVSAMERLKRVPPPYAQDHPRAELLKGKGLAVTVQPRDGVSASPGLLDWAADRLRAAAPLVNLLDTRLGVPAER